MMLHDDMFPSFISGPCGGRVENMLYISKIPLNALYWRGSERGKKNLRGGEIRRENDRERDR